MLPEARAETRELLVTARTVLAVAADPEVPMTASALALKTGLTEEAIIEVLNSQDFLEAMQKEFRSVAGLALRRGMSRMNNIIEMGKPEQATPAYRALLETYKVFAKDVNPQDEVARIQVVRDHIQKIQNLNNLKAADAKVTNARSRRAGNRKNTA